MRCCSASVGVRGVTSSLFRCWENATSSDRKSMTTESCAMDNHLKKKMVVDSPDSLPSIAATSVASSHQDEEGFAPRRLFMSHDGSTAAIPMENLCLVYSSEGKEVAYGSEASFTSSETTIPAKGNLSMRESEEEEADDVYMTPPLRQWMALSQESPLSNPVGKSHATANYRSPEVVEVEPPEEVASCNGALNLTPRQLAEIFAAFQGGRKFWSSSSKESVGTGLHDGPGGPSDSPTPPREELLLRECEALKKIIQEDSTKIINLKRAMQAQREMNTLQGIENDDRDVELRISKERIDTLKKEKEMMLEREEELLETIQILKVEVDKLSTVDNQKDDMTEGQALLAGIDSDQEGAGDDDDDYDHDPFEIVELRLKLEETMQENVQLKAQVEFLQTAVEAQCQPETSEANSDDLAPPMDNPIDLGAVFGALREISARLEAIEKTKKEGESSFLQTTGRSNSELNLAVAAEEQRKRDILKISQNPDEVEVLFPNTNREPIPPSSRCETLCCCDTWSGIGEVE